MKVCRGVKINSQAGAGCKMIFTVVSGEIYSEDDRFRNLAKWSDILVQDAASNECSKICILVRIT